MNKLTELKQIIADAPEGATHICSSDLYWNKDNYGSWLCYVAQFKQWDSRPDITDYKGYRSIADIRTIIEQAEEIKRLTQQNSSLNICLSDQMERIKYLEAKVAELENHKNYYQDFLKENTDCESITELVGKYKKQSQKIVELNQQVAFEMRQKAKAREQRDKVTKSAINLELKQNLGNWKGGAE